MLVPREMPFGKVHIRNMKEASDLGCVIVPPVLTFTMEQDAGGLICHIVGRCCCSLELTMTNSCHGRGQEKNVKRRIV